MPAGICLPPKLVDSFKQALISGKLNPEKLEQMSSDARHNLFKDVVGDANSKWVNSQFETKMLLKNRQQGYITWAKKLTGVSPQVRQDLMTKIGKMDERILNPAGERDFLKDLAATRLNVDVTSKEAQKIASLSSKVQAAKSANRSTLEDSLKPGYQPSANDMKFGYAAHDLHEYVNGLKHTAQKTTLADIKKEPFSAPVKLAKGVADVSKSIGASLDDSFALRQGFKAFFTNNKEWRQQFIKSFENLYKGAKDHEAVEREFYARMMADPAYESALKDGLAIKTNEDVFPTSLPGKVPILGRAFNASEVAYNEFAQNLRFNIYKNFLRNANEMGRDVPADYTKNMAKMVNSLTGRGDFGKSDAAVASKLNVAFYSARFLKANIDTLLLHPAGIGVGGIGSAAQKKAAMNLVKIIGGTAAILGTANALKPGSVDLDPRSANFGKVKIGDTRFDVSGGMDSLVELAAQQITGSSKSSSTGLVTKFSSKFGGTTRFDSVINFLANKTSPVGGVAVDLEKGQTHNNQKPTVATEGKSLFSPLGVTNFTELKGDKHSANIVASMILDGLGVATNTYGQSQKNYNMNPSKTLIDFQDKVGKQKSQQANKQYNTLLTNWMNTNQKKLNSLPEDDQQSTLTSVKEKIQSKVYKSYGFKPSKTKPSRAKKSLLQSVH